MRDSVGFVSLKGSSGSGVSSAPIHRRDKCRYSVKAEQFDSSKHPPLGVRQQNRQVGQRSQRVLWPENVM